MIEIINQGIGSSFQDLGRLGCSHLGVGRSGAADRPSHSLANRLVGNDESAATIETCGGLRVKFHEPAVVVVTGAQGAIDVRNGNPMGVNGVEHLPAGTELTLRAPEEGMRYYLAIRGGLEVEPVLGSRSFDTLAGLGPRLQAGDRIAIGADPRTPITTDLGVRPPPSAFIHLSEGPRHDWFTGEAWTTLMSEPYVVSPSGNRVGARLSGPVLERVRVRELLSEGLVEGSIQVPPDGQPIVMLADHPVTGGYPVIAVVAAYDLPSIVQARPGTALRFRHTAG
ncbi:MAG: biotin-dependent carboxyltransferase family protein [Ilumatobacteraceae bacterium]|nr:biotin-dependent carboxyltransferase family protein [Ilumatobacteraceae bacterium]